MAGVKRREASGPKTGRGRPSPGVKPEKDMLLKLYVRESRPIREVAEILGCKKDVVHYWLKKYGIPARTMAKRSKLLKYSLTELAEGVRNKGVRGYARELGVSASTLSRFMRSETE